MLYIVTYDLTRPVQDYQRLYNAITAQGQALRCLQSVWLLHSMNDVDTIQAALQATIDANDRMLVVDVTNRRRNGWLSRQFWDWMREHDF